MATSYPFRHRWLKTKTKYAIALVHVFSIACVLPYSVHLTLTASKKVHKKVTNTSGDDHDNELKNCTETWSSEASVVYTIFLFVIQYAAPLSIIITLYSITWTKINNHNKGVIRKAENQFRDSSIIMSSPATENDGTEKFDFDITMTQQNSSQSNNSWRLRSNSSTSLYSSNNTTNLQDINPRSTTSHNNENETTYNKPQNENNNNNKNRIKILHSNLLSTSAFSSINSINDVDHNDHNDRNDRKPRSRSLLGSIRSSISLFSDTDDVDHNDHNDRNDRKPRSRSLLDSIRNSISLFPDTDHHHQQRYNSKVAIERHKQTVKLLKLFIAIVLVFAVCMLPNHITWLYRTFNPADADALGTIPVTVAYWLTYTNSVVNPIIYGIHPKFRRLYTSSIKELVNFCCIHLCLKPQVCETPGHIGRTRAVSGITPGGDSLYGWTPESVRKRLSKTFSSPSTQPRPLSAHCESTKIKNGNPIHQFQIPIIKITPADDESDLSNYNDNDNDDDVFDYNISVCSTEVGRDIFEDDIAKDYGEKIAGTVTPVSFESTEVRNCALATINREKYEDETTINPVNSICFESTDIRNRVQSSTEKSLDIDSTTFSELRNESGFQTNFDRNEIDDGETVGKEMNKLEKAATSDSITSSELMVEIDAVLLERLIHHLPTETMNQLCVLSETNC